MFLEREVHAKAANHFQSNRNDIVLREGRDRSLTREQT